MKLNLLITIAVAALTANGAIITSNANTAADNATTQAAFNAAIGETPDFTVNFNGFVDGTNIHNVLVAPNLRLLDTNATGGNVVQIECKTANIGGSNPIGACAAAHDELAYLQLQFVNPVDYVSFFDIDSASTTVIVDFVGGTSSTFVLDTTASFDNSAEFVGIRRNDMPQIVSIRFDASGDGRWAVDNVSYGQFVPEPSTFGLFGAGALLLGLARSRSRRG